MNKWGKCMKYEFFRLLRDWTFWILLFLSLILVVGYSGIYLSRSEITKSDWRYFISEYENDDDLQKQIDDNLKYISQIEKQMLSKNSTNREECEELIDILAKSIKILQFLKGKTDIYPYKELCDGSVVESYSRSRRAYTNCIIEVVFIFQILAIIFVVGQVVNQKRPPVLLFFLL